MRFGQNPRLTKKDIGLIKGALRKAFSRSDLRNQVIEESVVVHSNPKRPKVKKWCRCGVCGKLDAKSYMVVDHIEPFIAIGDNFADMSLDEAIHRLWCVKSNLQSICETCHDEKSSVERKLRKGHNEQSSKAITKPIKKRRQGVIARAFKRRTHKSRRD